MMYMHTLIDFDGSMFIDAFYGKIAEVKNLYGLSKSLMKHKMKFSRSCTFKKCQHIQPSESTIKRSAERFHRSGSVQDERAGKYSRSSFSQENINVVSASVVEKFKMSISRLSHQVGLLKPLHSVLFERI